MSDTVEDHDHDLNCEVFGDCPVCDSRAVLPPTPAAGQALADEAIDRAAAAAPSDWVGLARLVIRGLAATGDDFTTDELWARLPSPPEPRAMGGIVRWAVNAGLIEATGRARPSVRPECHGRPVTIWKSTA